jgi:hypothetical protein
MSGKTIYETENPKTQTVEGVKALITYHNHGEAPKEMPAFYRMSGEMVLVKSNKGDSYYVTTSKDCSCPAKTYNPGKPCKHQRIYFKQITKVETMTDEPLIQRGGFKPFAEA